MWYENITLEQIAAFVVFVGALYGGVKYLKKELKDWFMFHKLQKNIL